MNLSDPWNFFDKIYCISLDARTDRRAQAKKQFADVGLLERVEFVIVAKHHENRVKGIFASHMLCLKNGLAAGAQHILVFEDDILFRGFDPRSLGKACSSLDRCETWNGLFLGCITTGSRKTRTRSLVKIKYRCLAHAYALNAPFAERMVREEWRDIPFDELMRRNNADFFAIHPMCAFQGLSGSDNETVVIDRMRRLFGGLPFVQKVNELYQNHKALIIVLQLAVLLVLGVLCKMW